MATFKKHNGEHILTLNGVTARINKAEDSREWVLRFDGDEDSNFTGYYATLKEAKHYGTHYLTHCPDQINS